MRVEKQLTLRNQKAQDEKTVKRDRMKTSRMTKPGIRDGCLNQEPETGI